MAFTAAGDEEEPEESEVSEEDEEEWAGLEEKGPNKVLDEAPRGRLGSYDDPRSRGALYEGDEEESSSGCDKEQDQDSDTSHEQGIEEVTDDSSEEANKDDLMKERHGS